MLKKKKDAMIAMNEVSCWIAIWMARASLVAQKVKSLPAIHETWLQSQGQEDPLENGLGEGNGNPPQYSCLGNPMGGEPGGLYPMGLQRVSHD